MELFDFILRLFIAIILGVAIGFERQYRQRSAGLRTNTLVSVGAAVYILLVMEKAAGKFTVLQGVTFVSWKVMERETE